MSLDFMGFRSVTDDERAANDARIAKARAAIERKVQHGQLSYRCSRCRKLWRPLRQGEHQPAIDSQLCPTCFNSSNR